MIDAESGAEIELIRPKAGDEKLHAQGGGAAANKIAGHTLVLRQSGFWVRARSSERQADGVLTTRAAVAAAERCYKDASEIIFYTEKSGAINLICQAENTVHISCEIQAAANMESLTIRGCCFCGGKDELWGC
jgi:hypothetical protein